MNNFEVMTAEGFIDLLGDISSVANLKHMIWVEKIKEDLVSNDYKLEKSAPVEQNVFEVSEAED